MAEGLVSEPMDVTRRRLREYLIPATRVLNDDQDDDGDTFPRSKVMRFAFNPRNRRVLMFSGSVLAVLATRLVGSNGIGIVADLARSLTGKGKR
jgi:hypothetical protein